MRCTWTLFAWARRCKVEAEITLLTEPDSGPVLVVRAEDVRQIDPISVMADNVELEFTVPIQVDFVEPASDHQR